MRRGDSSSKILLAALQWWVYVLMLVAAVGMVPTFGWAEVDPWEGANRKIHKFNDGADRAILKPLAKGYERVFPKFIRRHIHNVFRNIATPSVAVNQLLQGKGKLSASDASRFLINSTVGIGGLFDVATAAGLTEHEEDFGQTMVVWGVGGGPFVSIPLRGPATTTHAFGMLVEAFANPLRLISPARDRYIVYGVSLVDLRAELLLAESLVVGDEYLFLRDAYLQRREYLINDGELDEDPFLDDFEDYDE